MKRTTGALVAGMLSTALLVSGCGNLKKKEFLPEYEAYKAANEQRFGADESAIAANKASIGALEAADTALMSSINDAKEEAMASAEQGDADTLSAAKSSATEADGAMRDEVMKAINAAKMDAMSSAKSGDDEVRKDAMAALEEAKTAAMKSLADNASKSASNMESLRADIANELANAIPKKVGTVFFASGTATLSNETKTALDAVAKAAAERPSALVRVVGHADSRPILSGRYLTNLQLSEARAQAAADYLKSKGVSNKIEVSGRGHFQTEGAQSSSTGQQNSRRVEVWLASM